MSTYPALPTAAPSALYPEVEAFDSGFMAVDELHTLYWERCGNPAGIPVIFLHGGPGAGISPTSRRFFDPAQYHIVLLDQRGSGRSTPLGECRNNTTPLLLTDIERLREQLGIDQWLVFGGSWGSTLALSYAQAHPQRCLGLVLRGIWLGSQEEIDWWLYGMRQFYPLEWQAFAEHLPEAERGDLLAGYSRRMASTDPMVYGPATHAWRHYESSCLHLLPQPEDAGTPSQDAIAVGRLEAHYFSHRAFLAPGQLLNGVSAIRHLPCVIVHGRYDVICPVRYAFDLAQAWPEAKLKIIPDAGHSSVEPGIAAALVAATNRFAARASFD